VDEEAKKAKRRIAQLEMFVKKVKPVVFILFLAGKKRIFSCRFCIVTIRNNSCCPPIVTIRNVSEYFLIVLYSNNLQFFRMLGGFIL
jgi:hypothetical protein